MTVQYSETAFVCVPVFHFPLKAISLRHFYFWLHLCVCRACFTKCT